MGSERENSIGHSETRGNQEQCEGKAGNLISAKEKETRRAMCNKRKLRVRPENARRDGEENKSTWETLRGGEEGTQGEKVELNKMQEKKSMR